MEESGKAGLWREFTHATELLFAAMAPPSFNEFLGLPHSVKRKPNPLFTPWVPKTGEEREVARLLLALSERRGEPEHKWLLRRLKDRYPRLGAEEALAREVERAARKAMTVAGFWNAPYVVVSPASEFKALDFILSACHAGDFILLKWRRLRRLLKAEPPEVKITATVRALKRAKASWVIEVVPRETETWVARELRSLLRGIVKLRWRRWRLYVYGSIDRGALEEALEQACLRVQAELQHHPHILRRICYSELSSLAVREGVEVWEGELKGVEVFEVKTGTAKLSEVQKYSVSKLFEEAEKAREALGRQLEVAFKLARVDLIGFDVPRRAVVSILREAVSR